MRKLKCKKSLLFAVLLLLVMASGMVKAGSVTKISVNQTVYGQFKERGYVTYQVKVSAQGKLNVNFKHDNLYDTNTYWTVLLYAADMETQLQSYDVIGTDTNHVGASFGVTKGTYYVVVYARKSCSDSFSDSVYKLNVKFTKSNNWEVEYNASKQQGNDKQSTSTALTLGKTMNGSILKSSDVDYYSFKLTSGGYVTVNFAHKNIYDANSYWKVQIVNQKTDVVYEMTSAGTSTSQTTAKIGLSKGTYFVKITAYSSKYTSTVDYKLKVNFKKSSNWEKEYTNSSNTYNNSMSTANSISLNTTINGSLSSSSDVDYFKFKVKKTGYVSIGFTHKYISSAKTYFSITIYNSGTSTVYNMYSTGVKKSLTSRVKLKKGTYFVKISKGAEYSSTPYTVRISQ